MRWWPLISVVGSASAWASKSGIAADACSGCHSNAGRNATTLTLSPATFAPGELITVTVTISGAGSVGGLFLVAGASGFVTIDGQGARLLSGGVPHTVAAARCLRARRARSRSER